MARHIHDCTLYVFMCTPWEIQGALLPLRLLRPLESLGEPCYAATCWKRYIAEAVEVVDEEEQMMMTIRQPNEGVIVFGAPLGLVLKP